MSDFYYDGELEGTPEFNQQFRAVTSDLNPRLDGQDYQPAPYLVEDTRTGYDQDGNYHASRSVSQQRQQFQNRANLDTPNTPNLPYRLAVEIQEHIVREASTSDYTLGQAERHDMATDYAYELFNQNAFDPADIAFEALHHWQRIYGRGVQG